MRQSNEEIRAVARGYTSSVTLPAPIEGHYTQVDPELAGQIVVRFEALPVVEKTEEAHNAYRHLAYELRLQWDYIARMGYTFEPWRCDGQPYATSTEMSTDLREHTHLFFFVGGEPHPYLNETDDTGFNGNEQLRAVHDFFGHAAEGYQFGPRGEENAWIHHSQMFSPQAQRAMTTETRGANTWVNAGPFKHLPACDRPFAVQKAALLPVTFCDWKQALEGTTA